MFKLCENCGEKKNAVRLSWTAYITPFRNLYVVIQIVLALLATMGIMAALIFAGCLLADVEIEMILLIYVPAIGVGILAALFPVGALIHLFIVGSKELYIITDLGVWRGPEKRAPEMLSGGFSASGIASLLAGDFSMAGTSMLAAARIQQDMAWRDVKKVVYKPNWRLIILRVDALTKIWMFCTKENYPEVEKLVRHYTNNK